MTYKEIVESIRRKFFMSDETTQEVQTPAESQVGQEQQAGEETAPVETQEPAAEQPSDPTVTVSDLPDGPVEAAPSVDQSNAAPVVAVDSSAPVEIYYNGQVVVEKLEEVNPDGRLCKLADGTTAYVPLSILGE